MWCSLCVRACVCVGGKCPAVKLLVILLYCHPPPGTETANKLGCNLLADLALLDYFGFPSQNAHFSITVAMYILCVYIVKTVTSTCHVPHTVCHTYCIHLTSSL